MILQLRSACKIYFILLVCLVMHASVGHAQNSSETTYDASAVTEIVINGNHIFDIDVTTTVSDRVVLTSKLDGEYQNNYNIVPQLEGTTLNVALQQMGIDTVKDDKRNAHKVIGATLQVVLPKNKSIAISSDIGSVTMNGDFDTITVDLTQGSFKAHGTVKTAQIQTIDGSIDVVTKDALIETDSHHGIVNIPNIAFGFSVWKLKTHGGNITVKAMD